MQRLGAPPGMRFRALAASARVRVPLGSVLAVGAGAVALRLISGVGFANYDTLYALVWGRDLASGTLPASIKSLEEARRMVVNDYVDAIVTGFFMLSVVVILIDSIRIWFAFSKRPLAQSAIAQPAPQAG